MVPFWYCCVAISTDRAAAFALLVSDACDAILLAEEGNNAVFHFLVSSQDGIPVGEHGLLESRILCHNAVLNTSIVQKVPVEVPPNLSYQTL